MPDRFASPQNGESAHGDRRRTGDAEMLLDGAEHDGDEEMHDDFHDVHDDEFEDDYHHRARRKRRTGGIVALVSFALIVALAIGGAMVVLNMFRGDDDGGVSDYAGQGTGEVSVVVNAGDSLTDIAQTLAAAGVVASPEAFLRAANQDTAATSIQPGTYTLHQKMSAAAALTLMLNPTARTVITVTIPEGYRIDQVAALLAQKLPASAAEVTTALQDIPALGIPAEYGQVTSAEGFLYPATYDFQPGTTPAQALKTMVSTFAAKVSALGFVTKARALGVTPYEALIIASMAEAEAANDADWAKVSRVIYNRIDEGMPFGIDATSTYEARITGVDPMSVDYQVQTPYNTRLRPGFPPTPIGNPGEATLKAAIAPAAGNWLYYVQSDAKGTLTFTDSYDTFLGLAQACIDNSWGNC